jgi:hypothetical protein
LKERTEPVLRAHGNEDGSVTLSMPSTAETVTAAELDVIIRGLGEVRSRCLPEIPMDPPEYQRGDGSITVEAIEDPRYYIAVGKYSDMVVLLLRHPGYGWLAFGPPAKESERMREFFERAEGRAASNGMT